MKTLRKLLSIALIIAISLTSTALLASASPLHEDLPSDITTQGMNELTARSAVNIYFAERLDFLTGDSESIPSAVEPITNDEFLHKEVLISSNVHYISSTLNFTDINCWEDTADVTVEEAVIYLENSLEKNCVVTHKIVLYLNSAGNAVIGSDGYVDPITHFESASYLSPTSNASDTMAFSGSNLCILHIAAGEVGYEEIPNNITKYGEWYGLQAAWCAMFVSWCAHQADIPTNVIAKSASPITIKNELSNQGRHYLSAAYGGTYIPVPGDLIFINDTPAAPGHIGIVVSVSGNTIRIIDGNWGNKVCDRQISLSNTTIVGYGNPNYGSNNHESTTWHNNAAQHYKVCDHCSFTFAHAAHIYRQLNPTAPYICSICGHTRSYINEEM